jgi:uncharacterized protein (TIGR00730 family)
MPFDISWLGQIARWTGECAQAEAVRRRHPGPAVTLFGSARSKGGQPGFDGAVRVGRRLAERGVAVITGGGPGAMEAANLGAHGVDPALSMGFNIQLPHEQSGNDYVLDGVTFSDFAPRKVSMVDLADGFVFAEGGWGTRDELFEVLTKTQTQRGARRPVVLLESRPGIWDPLLSDARELADAGMISCQDLALLQVTDDPERAADLASEPALSGLPLKSMAETVPAWGPIHKLLDQHGLEAALLDPVASPGGRHPVVVLPASWLRGPAATADGGTLGDQLSSTLQEDGYRPTDVRVAATGVTAREYRRGDGDSVTVASVDWHGAIRPYPVAAIEDAVERSRHSIGPDNHVLGGAHRLALTLALERGSLDQLLTQPWVGPDATEGAITLLSRNPSRTNMNLASRLKRAHEHPGEIPTAGQVPGRSREQHRAERGIG